MRPFLRHTILTSLTGGILWSPSTAAYYIFGLPAGFILAFSPRFNLGLFGLWIGLTLALTITAVLTTWVIVTMDWEQCAEAVRKRIGGGPKLDGSDVDPAEQA